MNKDDIGDKLHRGYQATIDAIESLVKKEGKSLKDALHIAEQKLKDVEGLTADEYRHIRDEVRYDLHTMGERLSDAKTSFTQRLEMDSIFMKQSAIKKLSSIAQQTSQELVQIKDSLFNKEPDLEKDPLFIEHRDHREWHDEHTLWLKEIEMWRKEHHEAGAKLLAIHDAVRLRGKDLEEHAQSIRAHEIVNREHEALIAELEKQSDNKSPIEESSEDQASHQAMKKTHKNHALLHQQFRNEHLEMMRLVGRLHELLKSE